MIPVSSDRTTRYIRNRPNVLGASSPAGLTLVAAGRNSNPLWSRNLVSATGHLHTWSPWGKGHTTDGLPGFNGERTDPVSGSYHLGNGYRAYNPILGCFNCPDSLSPFGMGGINPYAYCAGDPINHTDPTGHISWPDFQVKVIGNLDWMGVLGIATGFIGLIVSIATAGAAVAAAGGVFAALESASFTTAGLAVVSVMSDTLAVISGIEQYYEPSITTELGWVSLAAGVAGMVTGIWLTTRVNKLRAPRRLAQVQERRLSAESIELNHMRSREVYRQNRSPSGASEISELGVNSQAATRVGVINRNTMPQANAQAARRVGITNRNAIPQANKEVATLPSVDYVSDDIAGSAASMPDNIIDSPSRHTQLVHGSWNNNTHPLDEGLPSYFHDVTRNLFNHSEV